jgi:TolA-binding protein
MKKPNRLLFGAAALLGLAAISGQPEFILPAAMLAGGAAVMKRKAAQRQLVTSIAEMEKRLRVTEGELESASSELNQLRVEREFDRQLLRAPNAPNTP